MTRRRVMAKAKLAAQPNGVTTPLADHLLTLEDVVKLTHVSERGLRNFVNQDLFPAPIKLGRRSLWSDADIQEWIRKKLEMRPRQVLRPRQAGRR